MRSILIRISSSMNATIKSAEPRRPPASKATKPHASSAELLRGASMLEIEHAGQIYILRVTRENKLILTK